MPDFAVPTDEPTRPEDAWWLAGDDEDEDDPLDDAYGYSRSDLLFGGNW